MLTVACWRWGNLFAPVYVNRLRSMLQRHLKLPHELVCITDNPRGIDDGIRIVPMPTEHADTPRCRRRMWQFAKERRQDLGTRILAIDLDVVLLDDITPIVNRPDPVCLWRVGYAGVYSGSFMLFDAGALDGAWRRFRSDPIGFPRATGERNASDQAMLNLHLADRKVAVWTEDDGFVTWFGKGYEALEHRGMGPRRPTPPRGARVVVLGSSDKAVMDERRYPFVANHWR